MSNIKSFLYAKFDQIDRRIEEAEILAETNPVLACQKFDNLSNDLGKLADRYGSCVVDDYLKGKQ